MTKTVFQSRLGWLCAALAARRNDIAALLYRLRDAGARKGCGMRLHLRFLHLMEQVAAEREREMELIHRIEEIEKRHRRLRRANLLRRAPRRIAAVPLPEPERTPQKDRLVWVLLLAGLFLIPRIKHKNQALTAD